MINYSVEKPYTIVSPQYLKTAKGNCSSSSTDYTHLANAVVFYTKAREPSYKKSLTKINKLQFDRLPKISTKSLISANLIAQQLTVCNSLNIIINESNICLNIKDDLFNILSDATHTVCEYTKQFKAMPLNEWDDFCNTIIGAVEIYETEKQISTNEANEIKEIAKTNVPFDYSF